MLQCGSRGSCNQSMPFFSSVSPKGNSDWPTGVRDTLIGAKSSISQAFHLNEKKMTIKKKDKTRKERVRPMLHSKSWHRKSSALLSSCVEIYKDKNIGNQLMYQFQIAYVSSFITCYCLISCCGIPMCQSQ